MSRRRRERETPEYAAMVRRLVRALGGRIGSGDPFDLQEFAAVQKELDASVDAAVRGLRATGFSWAEIGDGLGITKQAAHERFR